MAKTYRTHEVADIFPSMTDIEYEALKASIAENGQRTAKTKIGTDWDGYPAPT